MFCEPFWLSASIQRCPSTTGVPSCSSSTRTPVAVALLVGVSRLPVVPGPLASVSTRLTGYLPLHLITTLKSRCPLRLPAAGRSNTYASSSTTVALASVQVLVRSVADTLKLSSLVSEGLGG
ncbi:hypothetical protein G6F40_017670 [Rhizopus arrhizus]|nr:hypothetical protein G6F40_017670 [Rhizopus arrhizus]